MDRLILNGTDGFPLFTDTLAEAQKGWSVFNGLTGLAGDLAIIKGCETNGTNVADGFVSIAGELYAFKGGALGSNVIIKEIVTNREFKDKSTKPVYMERYATFGSSTPDKTFLWANFKRIDNLIKQGEKNIDFEARLKKLEEKPAELPVGVIMRYNQPLSVPPPAGWEDYSPEGERGRVWAAHDPNDLDFILGKTGGEKTHTLTINEMPNHRHSTGVFNKFSASGADIGGTSDDNDNHMDASEYKINSMTPAYWAQATEKTAGGGMAHENMPPYIAVRLIIKVK